MPGQRARTSRFIASGATCLTARPCRWHPGHKVFYGVHPRYEAYNRSMKPREERCIGFECQKNDFYCIDRCPQKALTLGLNPMMEAFGDPRWPSELLVATWEMAETGNVPEA